MYIFVNYLGFVFGISLFSVPYKGLGVVDSLPYLCNHSKSLFLEFQFFPNGSVLQGSGFGGQGQSNKNNLLLFAHCSIYLESCLDNFCSRGIKEFFVKTRGYVQFKKI